MNRPFAVMVLLLTLAGSSLAGDPTPAQRSTRPTNSSQPTQAPARPTQAREQARPATGNRDQNLIGAGVKRPSTTRSEEGTAVKQAAASNSRVVKANAQVMSQEVVYDEGGYAPSEGYVVNEGPVSNGGSCSTCGDGSCDGGSCGASCGSSCGQSGWGSCGFDICSPGPGRRRQLCICLPSHGWVQMDYLMWWQRGMSIPPLLTTSTAGTAQANAGVLGLNSTSTLIGDEDILTDRMNGGRIRFGWWFANCPKLGIEGEYFGLTTLREDTVNQSTGNPILARPFFNIAPGTGFAREDSELVAFPNVVSGSFTTNAFSTLDGAAVRFRRMLCCGSSCSYAPLCCGTVQTQSRIDATLGWRFLQLREGLSMREDLQSLQTFAPGSFVIQDNFRTRNQFNGVELGFLTSHRRGFWTLDGMLRVGFGNTRQEVTINGTTAITQNGQTQNFATGILAQRTNTGNHVREQFGVVPEFGATLGYSITPRWRLTAGYSFIYWSNVVRPGDQIDHDVNPNLFPRKPFRSKEPNDHALPSAKPTTGSKVLTSVPSIDGNRRTKSVDKEQPEASDLFERSLASFFSE